MTCENMTAKLYFPAPEAYSLPAPRRTAPTLPGKKIWRIQ
jgi:hypothetical protein